VIAIGFFVLLVLLGAWKLVELGVAGVEWFREWRQRRPARIEMPSDRVVVPLEGWRRR
jgi:hypothetical protein